MMDLSIYNLSIMFSDMSHDLKMFPASHKTVFVLDHSSYFAQPCGEKMNYDVYSRTKTPGVIPAAHINKPLWTCSVECLFEYMRIVFDVFPVDKLVKSLS